MKDATCLSCTVCTLYMYTDQQKCMLEVEFLNNADTNLGPVQELFTLVSGEFQR